MGAIAENLARVREGIAEAALRAGRSPSDVELMAVSKFHPESAVREAIEAGQTLFGENRVQEAAGKFPAILADRPDVRVHLIGTLQRNKARDAVSLFSMVQSVDRLELLEEIELRAARAGKTIDVLFELHTGEASKAGFASEDELWRAIDRLANARAVRCRGLMTMAPFTDDEGAVRASFRMLSRVRDRARGRYPSLSFDVLSMGMSGDYRIAIEEGSTLVRVGTAIFGERA